MAILIIAYSRLNVSCHNDNTIQLRIIVHDQYVNYK